MAGVSSLPPLSTVIVLLFIGMMALGMGNGAVFQLVPQHFAKEIGMVTGIVGRGGIGGFPSQYFRIIEADDGNLCDRFYLFSCIALLAFVLVRRLFWRKAMALKTVLRMFKFGRKTRMTACLFMIDYFSLDFKRRIYQNK